MLMLIWRILTEKTYLKQAKIKVVIFDINRQRAFKAIGIKLLLELNCQILFNMHF